jgi:hypothetical protein
MHINTAQKARDFLMCHINIPVTYTSHHPLLNQRGEKKTKKEKTNSKMAAIQPHAHTNPRLNGEMWPQQGAGHFSTV